jgi:hypothetical protein
MKKEVRVGSLVHDRSVPSLIGVVYAWGIVDEFIEGPTPRKFCRVKWTDASLVGGWSRTDELVVLA